MKRDEFVFPIFPETDYEECGCGFFIGNLFITAGHVIVPGQKPYIVHKGAKITLSNPLFQQFEGDNDRVPDIAIFKIDDFSSNICLSNQFPVIGMELKSESFRFPDPRIAVPVSCTATISVLDDIYFGAETSVKLWGGSSGSPILIENEVIGMLVRGNNGDNKQRPLNFCVFLSSKSIISAITQIQN